METPESLKKNRRRIGFVILGLVFAYFVVYAEVRGVMDTNALCDGLTIGSALETGRPALDAMRTDYKARFGSLFAINFFTDPKPPHPDTGAVVFVLLGWFPFGRQFCVANVEQGVIRARRTVMNADDYRFCNGDIRMGHECPDQR